MKAQWVLIALLMVGCGEKKEYKVTVHLANASTIDVVTKHYETFENGVGGYGLIFDSGTIDIGDKDLAWVDVEKPGGGKETWFSISYQHDNPEFNPNEITLRKMGYTGIIPPPISNVSADIETISTGEYDSIYVYGVRGGK